MQAATKTLLDPIDRAQPYKHHGLIRINLNLVGFWPGNRGFVGIQPYHVHEVAHDIAVNTTKLDRYNFVIIVKIPPHKLNEVREANRLMCEQNPLMPPHSPGMEYCVLSKTHFTFAAKLIKQGGRTLYDVKQGQQCVAIKLKPTDAEGRAIQEHGCVCQMYGQELWDDEDAMTMIAGDDNLNAKTQLAESEHTAFTKVSRIYEQLSTRNGNEVKLPSPAQVLISLEANGLGSFSKDDWKSIIALRGSMSATLAKLFTDIVFQATGGTTRVRTADYRTVACMDGACNMVRIATLVHQYLDTHKKTKPSLSADSYIGREDIFAKTLQPDSYKLMAAEIQFNKATNEFTIKTLMLYNKPPNKDQSAIHANLLKASGSFLNNVGSFYKNVALQVSQKIAKGIKTRQPFLPADIQAYLGEELTKEENFPTIEKKFRINLVHQGVFDKDSLPTQRLDHKDYKADKTHKDPEPAHLMLSQKPVQQSFIELIGADGVKAEFGDGEEPCELTHAAVFEKLGLKALGEYVMAFKAAEVDSSIEGSGSVIVSSVLETLMVDGDIVRGKWAKAELKEVHPPKAKVIFCDISPPRHADVHIDALRAMSADVEVASPVIPHPCDQTLHTKVRGPYNINSWNTHFTLGILTNAINQAHATSSMGLPLLHVTVLDGPVLGGPKLQTVVLQVTATSKIAPGGIFLSPACGSIAAYVSGDKPYKVMNPDSIKSVPAFTYATAFKNHAEKDIPHMRWIITSPLHYHNNKKRKFGDPTLAESVADVPPYWAVLHAPEGKTGNMQFDVLTVDDCGIKCGNKLGNFKKGCGYKIDIPFLTNTKMINSGEVLMLDPRLVQA